MTINPTVAQQRASTNSTKLYRKGLMAKRGEKSVRLLCASNFYRSRLADPPFNSAAGVVGLPWMMSARHQGRSGLRARYRDPLSLFTWAGPRTGAHWASTSGGHVEVRAVHCRAGRYCQLTRGLRRRRRANVQAPARTGPLQFFDVSLDHTGERDDNQ